MQVRIVWPYEWSLVALFVNRPRDDPFVLYMVQSLPGTKKTESRLTWPECIHLLLSSRIYLMHKCNNLNDRSSPQQSMGFRQYSGDRLGPRSLLVLLGGSQLCTYSLMFFTTR
jgi:hypothetical protein